MAFVSIRDDPDKNPYYAYTITTPPSTPTPVPTATPVPPRCASERFKDVCPGDYFYQYVLDLNDAGVISGYNTSPPCPNNLWIPCFLSGITATRGQVSKIITLGASLTINTAGGPHFADVPTTSTFYNVIETMFNASIISGYPCGGTGEPCMPGNKPYFRPGNNINRAQLAKIVALCRLQN